MFGHREWRVSAGRIRFLWCISVGFAFVASACRVYDANVEGRTSALVGGALTSARPEIGTFTRHGCAATLIAPAVALTSAGGCIDSSEAVQSGDAFAFTDVSGVPRSVAVIAIHTFSGQTTGAGVETFLPSGGTDSVTLLRLASAVPGSQLTPALIASTPPLVGDTVTAIGYGATNCSTNANLGSKNYLTYRYGTTVARCNDGGGPRVLGGLSANGAIFALSDSGVTAMPSRDGGAADLLGNPVFYKSAIMAIIREWSGNAYEVGFDRPGANLNDFEMSSSGPAACAAACSANQFCRAFVNNNGTHCWLKYDYADWVPNPTFTSGIRPAYEVGYDRPGSDLPGSPITTSSLEMCRATCARNAQCVAFTSTAGTSPVQCWLKGSIPGLVANSNYTSGIKADYVPADLPGSSYSDADVANLPICAAQCAQSVGCKAYSFGANPSTGNLHCWLKNSVPAPGPLSFFSSAVKGGMMFDTDHFGGNWQEFDLSGPNAVPQGCQVRCALTPDCQSWTFAPFGWLSPGHSAHCWIKNVLTPATFSADLVTGIKGMEFLDP